MRAAFPGSFDPLTVAHLAVADAVRAQRGAERVDLVLSHEALGKEGRAHSSVAARLRVIEAHAERRPWIRGVATDAQLLVDIAEGYDILVVGADKWHQLHDPRYYGGSETARDEALARLPSLAIVPRAGVALPHDESELLQIPEHHREVSSTAVREGRHDWRA